MILRFDVNNPLVARQIQDAVSFRGKIKMGVTAPGGYGGYLELEDPSEELKKVLDILRANWRAIRNLEAQPQSSSERNSDVWRLVEKWKAKQG